MKLQLIIEAFNRRGFLRAFGGGVGSIMTGSWKNAVKGLLSHSNSDSIPQLAKLYDDLPEKSKQYMGEFVFNLVNYPANVKDLIKDGMVCWWDSNSNEVIPIAPVESIAGYYASDVVKDPISAASILTGEDPSQINNLFPGLMERSIDYAVKKHGPELFINSIASVFNDLGYASSDTFNAWKIALSNKTLQATLGLTPDMISKIEATGAGLSKMVDKGMISRDIAGEWSDILYQQRAEQKPEQQKPDSDNKTEKLIDIKPPKDYELANSMHQPFESKLNKILSI